MARVRKDASLGSRDARECLKIRREPYFRVIEVGLSIGYRRTAEGGSWVVRRYDRATRRHTEMRLGNADDSRDADGVEVLSFAQAQRKALSDATSAAMELSGQLYTVGDAITDYLVNLAAHGRKVEDTQLKLTAYVPDALRAKKVTDLKPTDFSVWLDWAVKRPAKRKPRKTPKKIAVVKDAVLPSKADVKDKARRRRSTINRVVATLKACLNHAYATSKVPSREAWQGLKKFKNVGGARLRWLSEEEAIQLQAACRSDLRLLVRAALFTGCREGELLSIKIGDIDTAAQTLLIPESKSGKPRQVPLSSQAVNFFTGLAGGKKRGEALFVRADGSSWHRVAVIRAMQDASKSAGLEPAITFHGLRHTYASHLVRKGTPLVYIAYALGHGDTRMVEKHYGHLSPSHVAETIRSNLPTFGDTAIAQAQLAEPVKLLQRMSQK